MSADGTNTNTINQLLEIFHQSRSRGEWVNLSMESKDGKDFLAFSIGRPAGAPAGYQRSWTPRSTPRPPMRRKTPSQWRRDQKRRQEFIAKKISAAAVIKEEETLVEKSNADVEVPADEIELTEIPTQAIEPTKKDLFNIVGEYKNPKFKPWSTVEPEKDVKTLWELLKRDNTEKGIEEIGEGSTCFEHCFEFWGKWKINNPEITSDFLKNSENWPKGVKIIEVKPA